MPDPAPTSEPVRVALGPAPASTRAAAAEGWLERAPVTRALLALQVGVFAVEGVLSRGIAITPGVELRLGACYPLAALGEGRWETLVTACCLHGSVVHLAFNLVALWMAGPLVERAMGSGRLAPLVLAAGALGNVASVARAAFLRSGAFSVGASGAVSGVLVAALVIGWRLQGWRGSLTRGVAGLVVIFALLAAFSGGSIDHAAHAGGAVTGALFALTWRREQRLSERATRVVLWACVATLTACITILSVREALDPMAAMTVQERQQFTTDAVRDGRCRDAHEGLRSVERLRGSMDSLRRAVEVTCGHVNEP